MMVPAGRHERCLRAIALGNGEAQDAHVERECPIEVRDFQVDVANAGTGGNGHGTYSGANLRTTTPARTRATPDSLIQPSPSPNSAAPTATVPMAPIPVQAV